MGEEDLRKIWYVVNDPASREYTGPYSVTDLLIMLEDGRLHMESSWAFKKDDTSMVPISSIPGVDRRMERKALDLPLPETGSSKGSKGEWWYLNDVREPKGPLTLIELRKELAKGVISRETPVWKLGTPKWVYLFQVAEFDRRSA